MTGLQVLGMILLPVALILMAFANQKHRDEHGVNAPSRKAAARIRRNARQGGISQSQAHANWVENKQAASGPRPSMPMLQNANVSATVSSLPAETPTKREPSTFREWRRSSGMNVADIAKAAGLPMIIVQQIEIGTRTCDPETYERLVSVMREARDALPAPLPFEDIVERPVTVLYEPPSTVYRAPSRVSTGGYVAGHYRKDGTWVKPHWRKPKGY